MTRIAIRFQQVCCSVLLSAMITAPAAAASTTLPGEPSVRLVDDAGRVVISLGPLSSDGALVAGAVRLPRRIMLHRVSIEMLDADGGVLEGITFEATLGRASGDDALRPLVHLTMVRSAFALPRPLGLRLDAGETVNVFGSLGSGTGAALYMNITLEYEPLDGPVSRLAALPLQIQVTDAPGSEWRAPVDGRLMALAGLPANLSGELVLEDVETGAVVWREVLQSASSEAFSRLGDVVRVGAPVREGRMYRLTLRVHDSGDGIPTQRVHGLLVPVQSAGIAAK
jgi:hypothetical protein